MVEQHAAEHRSERDSGTGGCRPDADCHRALSRVGEHMGEQGERRGHDERGARAHDGAGEDELVDTSRERCCPRRQAEHRESEHECPAPPVPVAERSCEEQQSGEHERVRIHHPLELAEAGVEVAHERGQRHVDDRVVEDDGEQAQAEHRQREPTPPAGGAAAGRRAHDALRLAARASIQGSAVVASVTTRAPLEPNTVY